MKTLTLIAVTLAALVWSSSALEEETANPEVKLFAGYVTRTRFNVLTSTTLLSCISALGQNAKCGGRRKRSNLKNVGEELSIMEPNVALDGSQDELSIEKRDVSQPEQSADDKGKLFVSLTTFTTMTTTSFTANTATTVSVSFHCIPPDGVNYPFCL
ncbi:uncharacterized protein [Palaemon carinicauda]|uniref:uncharacterized protein n=1 Tax=Palaemon carinicauda TaxID=392227 RepID=UPI0035B65073